MATSGVYDLALTVNESLSEAYDMIGIGVDGEILSGDMFNRGLKSANLMLKGWQAQGIHLWSYTEGTLFLEVGRSKYDFRKSTTNATSEFFETTTTAATVANALSFLVTSAADIKKGDRIGIIQTDNNLFWTTVSKVNNLTVTVKDKITLSTLSEAVVYNYRPSTDTAPTLKPISRILDVRRRESTDYEIPIIFESREDYFNLPNKNQNGTPIQAYYSRQDVAGESSGIMYLWSPPESSLPVINFTYERKLQIGTNGDETLDIPDYAQESFCYNLAQRLLKFGGASVDRRIWVATEAKRSMDEMLSYDSAVYPITLDLGMDR